MEWTTINSDEGEKDNAEKNSDGRKYEGAGLIGHFEQHLISCGNCGAANQKNDELPNVYRAENFILDFDELGDDVLIWHPR